MTEARVGGPGVITSPVYRIKGQKSNWRYPDPRLTPEDCEVLRNVNLSERGTANSRTGYVLYNSTQLSGGEAGVGLFQETFKSGTEKRLVATRTKMYTDDGSTRADITGSDFTGGVDDRFQFEFLKDRILINNRVDQIRTYSGSGNTADLTGTLWTKAGGMFVHKNLLMVYDTTESSVRQPTRVRWCDINRSTFVVDITKWIAKNVYEIYDGGPPIVSAIDNWGTALFFKKDGMYPGEIFYDDPGFNDFRLGKPQRGFSPLGKKLVARPEFVFGIAREGIFVIRPDMSFEIVTRDNDNMWKGLNKSRLQYAQPYIVEDEHQVRTLVSSANNTSGHDQELVWDWETGDIWLDNPVHVHNIAERIDISDVEQHWRVSTSGFIYKGNLPAYVDDAGTGFDWRIGMAPNDLGRPGQQKHVLNIKTIHRKRLGQQDVILRAYLDEGRSRTVTGTLAMAVGVQWNEGPSWNTGKTWPGASSRRTDFEVNRHCESVAPEWTGSGPSGIEGYQVEYIPLEN